jgi:hypothetical protein
MLEARLDLLDRLVREAAPDERANDLAEELLVQRLDEPRPLLERFTRRERDRGRERAEADAHRRDRTRERRMQALLRREIAGRRQLAHHQVPSLQQRLDGGAHVLGRRPDPQPPEQDGDELDPGFGDGLAVLRVPQRPARDSRPGLVAVAERPQHPGRDLLRQRERRNHGSLGHDPMLPPRLNRTTGISG